jgi:hypothetical protein
MRSAFQRFKRMLGGDLWSRRDTVERESQGGRDLLLRQSVLGARARRRHDHAEYVVGSA